MKDLTVLWIGGDGGMEARLVERAAVPFKSIPAAGLHGVGLRQVPGNLQKLVRGVSASRRILKEFRPDVLFFTGGFVAVPMALAGRKIPSVLFVPDIEPGLALKTLARFAHRIAITADESRKYFLHQDQLVCTGYPTRTTLAGWSREEARRKLKLTNQHPVMLVFGGSKGAHSLNKAVLAHLPELLEMVQLIHISGELDWPEVELKSSELNHPHYHAYSYLHEEMGAALAASDIVLSRAGASTLGEYPLFGLPAILVPYPYAWKYQKVNADYLVGRNAAVLIEDAQLPEQLVPVLNKLLTETSRLASMHQAVKALAQPQAAASISNLLVEMAQRGAR
jgi:UDP-N-acetylglucosamine--N-acetylmuramyl-(pentapeptide) pyrophosphoryl-undecaprenol N-acetylglucosamine transferase